MLLGDIPVDVVKKDIKNVHLSVHPPAGSVRISAPRAMNDDSIRCFALSRLGWIRKQQHKFIQQDRETPREYLERESHFVWGERRLLRIEEKEATPSIQLQHRSILMQVRPGTGTEKKQQLLDDWYRQQLKSVIPEFITNWEKKTGVQVTEFGVRKMKTRWGTCNPQAKRIWLNLELAKKPKECLEYIVVHEMVHLIEPTHNKHFAELMNTFLPQWKHYRDLLNRLPVRHEDWGY
ncbi:MAG: M48 family metallopeptidase [Chlorobiaceae bacterium]|nr:M48 family metallopeptidase [Chlorobiaceae bacterium]